MEIGNFDLRANEFDFYGPCEGFDSEPNGLQTIIEISFPFIEKLPLLWQGWC